MKSFIMILFRNLQVENINIGHQLFLQREKIEQFNMVVRVNLVERLGFKISLRTKFSFKNEEVLFLYLELAGTF